nr:hypothetical protein [Tanacetum cinerariifolium]
MSSIIAQQAKLDLELVPKKKRLKIRKCNERLNPRKIQREPTFQVILDALALTPRYSAFLITVDVPERTFAVLINKSLSGKTTGLDKLRLSRAQILWGMYLREATPPKKARKLEKPASPKLTSVLVLTEEPTRNSKRVKRLAKKSTKAPANGVVIRETLKMPVSKKKEKVDVTQGKGIELLYQVALTEDAHFKEVQRKSMRGFHKTNPSGSGTVTKTALSAAKIKPSVTNEGSGVKPGVLDVTKEESSENSEHEIDESESGSKSDHEENEEDEDGEEEVKDEFVKNPSNDSGDEDEAKITDKAEVDTDKGFVQDEGIDAKTKVPVTSSSHLFDLAAKFLNFVDIPHTDAEIVSPMDVHVHHEVPSQQTPILLTVHVLIIFDSSPLFSTIIPQSLPSFNPLPHQSTSTPPTTNKATNPPSILPDFASVFRFNNRVTTLEKEPAKLKKDPLYTQVTTLVDDRLDARLGATRDEFMNFLSASLTARITEQVKNQLPKILPEEVSKFVPR